MTLQEKKRLFLERGPRPEIEEEFSITYTYDEMKICNNTCSRKEVKQILINQESVGGKKMVELFQVVNHMSAQEYLKKCLEEQMTPGEEMLRQLHRIFKWNIIEGGHYRQVDYQDIKGRPAPCLAREVPGRMKPVYQGLEQLKTDISVGDACYYHAMVTRIHPFESLNGGVARLMGNYLLMRAGWLPVSISPERFNIYFEHLNTFYRTDRIEPFAKFMEGLEEERLNTYLKEKL